MTARLSGGCSSGHLAYAGVGAVVDHVRSFARPPGLGYVCEVRGDELNIRGEIVSAVSTHGSHALPRCRQVAYQGQAERPGAEDGMEAAISGEDFST